MFFNLILSLVLSGLDSVIKNPEKKAKYREILLQIAAKIIEMYGQAVVSEVVAARKQ